MKQQQAKEYFDLGIIVQFFILRDPMVPGHWMVAIEGKEGRSWSLHTALSQVKSFASVDTAVKQIEQITGRVSSLAVHC